MTQLIQLDFFRTPEECEQIAMREQIARLKESQDKVRKKLFAENGKLVKSQMDLEERMAILERNICRG